MASQPPPESATYSHAVAFSSFLVMIREWLDAARDEEVEAVQREVADELARRGA